MRIAYFDMFSGISGDMLLGAIIHAGIPIEHIRNELAKLPLSGYHLNISMIERSMVSAAKIDVHLIDEMHEHHGHHHHADYAGIRSMILASGITERAKGIAVEVFDAIAKAEAKIHAVPVEKVHFHEVGAVDSIVDIVGSAIGLDALGIEAVYTSRALVGSSGFIETQHGTMPIPTPATLEILSGYPVEMAPLDQEFTTPTGAGFIKALSKGVLPSSSVITVERIGYGAGTREIPGRPNLFRLVIGEYADEKLPGAVTMLETNIDDMNPEIFPHVIERLLEEGANDAYIVPIIMKKGRPAFLLVVNCEGERVEHVTGVLFAETTTTGVRISTQSRMKLLRKQTERNTRFGVVRFKEVHRNGAVTLVPEFEECRRIAKEYRIPLVDVYAELEYIARTK